MLSYQLFFASKIDGWFPKSIVPSHKYIFSLQENLLRMFRCNIILFMACLWGTTDGKLIHGVVIVTVFFAAINDEISFQE